MSAPCGKDWRGLSSVGAECEGMCVTSKCALRHHWHASWSLTPYTITGTLHHHWHPSLFTITGTLHDHWHPALFAITGTLHSHWHPSLSLAPFTLHNHWHLLWAFYDLSGINIYHIYADVCPPARVSAPARALAHAMQHQNVPLRSSSSSSSMATKTAAKRSTLGVAGTEDDDGDSGE
eukprot:1159307-Pelagomonas_calceolata.AAC.6